MFYPLNYECKLRILRKLVNDMAFSKTLPKTLPIFYSVVKNARYLAFFGLKSPIFAHFCWIHLALRRARLYPFNYGKELYKIYEVRFETSSKFDQSLRIYYKTIVFVIRVCKTVKLQTIASKFATASIINNRGKIFCLLPNFSNPYGFTTKLSFLPSICKVVSVAWCDSRAFRPDVTKYVKAVRADVVGAALCVR